MKEDEEKKATMKKRWVRVPEDAIVTLLTGALTVLSGDVSSNIVIGGSIIGAGGGGDDSGGGGGITGGGGA